MKKNIEWLKEEITEILLTSKKDGTNYFYYRDLKEKIYNAIDQLDEAEVLSQEWIGENVEYAYFDMIDGSGRLSSATAIIRPEKLKNILMPKKEEADLAYHRGFKEGGRQTAEYFESITEEPSKEQVWKYLSEHGIEVVEKDPLAAKVEERNNKQSIQEQLEENLLELLDEDDKVNSPSHYTRGDTEVIDIIKQLVQGYEPFEAYLVGNAIKYLARANFKENKRRDLEKSQWHINKLLEEQNK